jgi:predicted DNA binding protein
MRKFTVVISPHIIYKQFLSKEFFEKLEYWEGKHLVRFDPKKGVKIAIVDFKMRDGYDLEDLDIPKMVEVLDVIKQDGTKYTCLIKAVANRAAMKLVKMFDFDVVWEPPFHATRNRLILSFISDNKQAKSIIKALKIFGSVDDVHIQKAVYLDTNPMAMLTDKQKEVILMAKKIGYYEVPRKASSKKLAKELQLSKATAVEHLRKAEKRLINYLLAGY